MNIEPSENEIHLAVMEWVIKNPELRHYRKYFLHVPNEGKRTFQYGRNLKRLGMRKGVSDLFIAHPSQQFHGAWIELKKHDGRLSAEQKIFLLEMDEVGYFTSVCYSIEEAIQIIEWYFEIGS